MPADTLRPATAADQAHIVALVWRVGINPRQLNWRRFWVIERAGELAAIGQIKPHGEAVYELASIATHPNHRGQGLATRLIQHLLTEFVAAHPGLPLYLMCEPKNRAFYPRFGFADLPLSAMPRYFRRLKSLVAVPEKLAGRDLLVVMHRPPPEKTS